MTITGQVSVSRLYTRQGLKLMMTGTAPVTRVHLLVHCLRYPAVFVIINWILLSINPNN
jgi:hypothetical protein